MAKVDRHKRPELGLWRSARTRGRIFNIAFSITVDDIIIPDVCPILGIPLILGDRTKRDSSPSIDRIIPSLGYTKENIVIISLRANRIKSDATIMELGKIYQFYNRIINQ